MDREESFHHTTRTYDYKKVNDVCRKEDAVKNIKFIQLILLKSNFFSVQNKYIFNLIVNFFLTIAFLWFRNENLYTNITTEDNLLILILCFIRYVEICIQLKNRTFVFIQLTTWFNCFYCS